MNAMMICPWFGPLPAWRDQYVERLRLTGCDFYFDHNLTTFRHRVADILDVGCPIEERSAKIHDYRPVLGKLYADELAGYKWWGHTDFDCVYGRVEEFVTSDRLAGCDIQTDCAYDYLAGPWTLYRNLPEVNDLYLLEPEWRQILEDERVSGWVEKSFSEIAKREVRVRRDFLHDYRDASTLRADGDRLLYGDREIPFFHFNRTKVWPL